MIRWCSGCRAAPAQGRRAEAMANRKVEQAEQENKLNKHKLYKPTTVRSGNPIAESLWPTLPNTPAGPFHRDDCHGPSRDGAGESHPPRLRAPDNLKCANGFPVSAYS